MKKTVNIVRWVGAVLLGLFAVIALTSGSIFSGLSFILSGVFILPNIKFTQVCCEKFNFCKGLSIVLAVLFLLVGVLSFSTNKVFTTKPKDEPSISKTTSVDNSTEDNIADKPINSEITSHEDKPSDNTTSSSTNKSTLKPTISNVGSGKPEPVIPSKVAAYSGKAYITINNNIPNFRAAELTTKAYEKYSVLDSLGRCGVALASCGKEIMPGEDEERGSIGSIKPTGWVQAKYDCISGKYLYNRSHLIGWQLSAENANNKNLITGTKYLNVTGMLPFENMVADYIDETGNHVAYRITPIFEGNNLLCSGVQMEAYSIEDQGEGICFNVYCYNVQPGVKINYKTGVSSLEGSLNTNTDKDVIPSGDDVKVWISGSGSKYHSKSSCSGMKNPSYVTKTYAERQGRTPCSKCY